MSDLTDARDHANEMANGGHRPACLTRDRHTPYFDCGERCPGGPHVCDCDPPDATERRMWQAIADELDAYLDHKAANDDPELPL